MYSLYTPLVELSTNLEIVYVYKSDRTLAQGEDLDFEPPRVIKAFHGSAARCATLLARDQSRNGGSKTHRNGGRINGQAHHGDGPIRAREIARPPTPNHRRDNGDTQERQNGTHIQLP